MKILICSLYLPSGQDGVSNSTRALVSAVESKGVDVTVYTTDWGWPKEERLKHQSGKLRVFRTPFNNNYDLSFEMIHYVRETCGKYDLIYFRSIYSFATVLGSYLSRRYHIPYIVSPCGNFVPLSGNNYNGVRSIRKKKLFFNLLLRKVLIGADKVICSSEQEMVTIQSLLSSDNITYIHNGLDPSPFCRDIDGDIIKERLGINPDRSIFLFLGRLAEEKAIPFLLQVWDCVSKKLPHALLVIAGSGEHGSYEKIKENVKQLSHPETVLMPGAITGNLKIALLRKSRCLLLPSYFESFGNVVLEALISGTPVIASIGTPWRTLEENNFGKWLPWDVEKWVKAILDTSVNDIYQGEAFYKRSHQWVINNFSWSNIADKYISIFEEIKK